jgi:hypothetical protein
LFDLALSFTQNSTQRERLLRHLFGHEVRVDTTIDIVRLQVDWHNERIYAIKRCAIEDLNPITGDDGDLVVLEVEQVIRIAAESDSIRGDGGAGRPLADD